MIFCLFNLHLVSYGFGVGEAWNGREKGEEGANRKTPATCATEVLLVSFG